MCFRSLPANFLTRRETRTLVLLLDSIVVLRTAAQDREGRNE
jgi:hypothetical protein